MAPKKEKFHTFLSHSHDDATWVEQLARRLEDECGFRVWLDRWILVPGSSWQQSMAKGLEDAATCAICVGGNTPEGWFKEEIERALDLQSRDQDFRVIPVLLPDTSRSHVPGFLSLRTWADFGEGQDVEYAFHVLRQGIKGEAIGRWPPSVSLQSEDLTKCATFEDQLKELNRFEAVGLSKEVRLEYERMIMAEWWRDGRQRYGK